MAARFEKHLFISYAHLDNLPLPEQENGWVSRFHSTLEAMLSTRLGCRPSIWRDLKLSGNDIFADEIVAEFSKAAVLVSIISPRYVQSDWCRRELREFCEAAEKSTGLVIDNKSRAIKVLKLPVETEDALPPVIRQMLGHSFFVVDDGEMPLELDPAYGRDISEKFNLKAARLAWDIAQMVKRLESLRDPAAHPAPDTVSKKSIYLAECSFDRRDDREAIASELRMRGYIVLPDEQLPRDEAAYAIEVKRVMEQCGLAIHIIGSGYGAVPDGPAPQSIVVLQNEAAIAQSRKTGLPRIIWLPEGTRSDHPLQQSFIDALHSDADTQFGADLVTGNFESFKETTRTALKSLDARKTEEKPATAEKLIYIVCDEQDRQATLPLRRFLKARGLECSIPVFEGDAASVRESNRTLLLECDAVLVFYGYGDEVWKRYTDSELRRIKGLGREKPLPPVFSYLAPPLTADKSDLLELEEPNLLNGLEGFSEGALTPLLDTLR